MEDIFNTLAEIVTKNQQTKSKLDILKEKRDKIKTTLNRQDPLQKSFYCGRVGFKTGTARKKWEKSIDKELDLMHELSAIEEKIERLENPIIRKKAVEKSPSIFSVGDICYEPFGNKVTVTKINQKTVSVVYESGFKENIKPHLLSL